jgi:tRNA1Val (adenine37-N6)-methyltransferase
VVKQEKESSHSGLIKSPWRSGGFTFKQFFVAHDRCAMKVGTDGVLLGVWSPVAQVTHVLDIGTGSGLIALMLAQRTCAQTKIDAVELEVAAAQQAQENFSQSPWAQRLQLYAMDIHQFTHQTLRKYDLIVSNPPYFQPAVACRDQARHTARYTQTLTHEDLLSCAASLLTADGRFCVVLPYDIGLLFQQQAQQQGWYTLQRLDVRDSISKPFHRLLLTLSRQCQPLQQQQMTLRDEGGRYSAQFAQLVSDFYLNY